MNTDNLRGSALMVAAMAGFALSDMFIKQASATIPVGEVLLYLGVSGTLVFAILAKLRREVFFDRSLLIAPLFWRSLGEIIGTVGFVTAITRIPISNASAIIMAMPLVVTLGAVAVYGAQVGWRRWLAISAGMVGVLVVIRPGPAGFDINSLFAIQAVIGLAIRDLATRAIPERISSIQVSTLGFAVMGATGLVMTQIGTGLIVPNPNEIWVLLAALGFGLAGYYAITAAMRIGEVAVVTPFRYSRLLFALVIGVLVFNENLDALMLVGSAIIVLSGLYSFVRERKQPAPLLTDPALR